MDLVEFLLPSPRAVLYLGNVAAAVLLSSFAALLANAACRRRWRPFRYGLLLLGLVLVLTVPATVWLTGRAGIGGWRVAVSQTHSPVDMPSASPDSVRPTLDIRPGPAKTETEAADPSSAIRPGSISRSRETSVELPGGSPPPPIRPAEQGGNRSASSVPIGSSWWWSLGQGLALAWGVGTAAGLVWLHSVWREPCIGGAHWCIGSTGGWAISARSCAMTTCCAAKAPARAWPRRWWLWPNGPSASRRCRPRPGCSNAGGRASVREPWKIASADCLLRRPVQ